jgi:hypothetical protein
MLMAKKVSALPKTEMDCVTQTIRNVRQPLGGGV